MIISHDYEEETAKLKELKKLTDEINAVELDKLFKLGGIEYDYGAGYEVNEKKRKAWKEAAPAGFAVCCIYSMFYDSKSETYFGYQGSLRKNQTLDVIYKFLCALGYQMCDEETAWQNGTHELF